MFSRIIVVNWLIAICILFIMLENGNLFTKATTTTCPPPTNITSVRDWLNTLNQKSYNIQVTITKLEKIVYLLSNNSATTSLNVRQTQLANLKKTQLVLIEEINIINSTCNTHDGPDCDIPKCVMGNSTCTQCKSGWTGINCTIPICSSNCNVCITPDSCQTCKSGWNGTNCTIPICSSNCNVCIGPSICQTCKSGWNGTNCDVQVQQQLVLSNSAFKYGSISLKSCAEYKSKLADSVSGLYWISPNAINEFIVYCEQSFNGGGWVLISSRKSGSALYYSDIVNPNNDGASMNDDRWAMIRSISTDIMWRDSSGSDAIGVSLISFWNSANCQALSTKLTDMTLGYYEVGCDGGGSDYCILGSGPIAYNSYIYGYCGLNNFSQWTFSAKYAYLSKSNVYVR